MWSVSSDGDGSEAPHIPHLVGHRCTSHDLLSKLPTLTRALRTRSAVSKQENDRKMLRSPEDPLKYEEGGGPEDLRDGFKQPNLLWISKR